MSFSHEFLLVNKISPQFPEFTGPFKFYFFDDWLLRLPSSPETEAVWLSSTETWRSWLDVCTTVWQSVSIHIPSPPSVLRLSHSWSLRWTSWEQAVRLWRRQMTNWVILFFFFSSSTYWSLFCSDFQTHLPSSFSLCLSQSYSSLWVNSVCVNGGNNVTWGMHVIKQRCRCSLFCTCVCLCVFEVLKGILDKCFIRF